MNDPRGATVEAAIESATHPGEATGAEVAIRLENVVKTYGSGEVAVHALRGVDLEIRAISRPERRPPAWRPGIR